MAKDKDEIRWAQKIADIHGPNIPLRTKTRKGEALGTICFKGPAKLKEMVEVIYWHKKGQFKSPSEVWRAASWIGIHLLYRIIKGGDTDIATETMFNHSQEMMVLDKLQDKIDGVLENINQAHFHVNSALITWEEYHKTKERFIKEMDFTPEQEKIVWSKLSELESGKKNIRKLVSYRTEGRSKKSSD